MSLRSRLMVLITRRSAKRFERATHDPENYQREKLLEVVRRNQDTMYGRRYGFSEIRSIEDYQRRVPMVNYEDIRKDVERALHGEKAVLTAEDPVMFARTSGTTGEPKFIPITPTDQGGAHRDVMRAWLYHCFQAHPIVFDGKVVTLVSPAVEGFAPSGVPFGSTSGHMYKNMPAFARRAYAIPYRVFEIEDYAAKYYAIMRLSMAHDVTFLCTANPSSVLKMCEKGNEYGESIIRDIRNGTISEGVQIEPEIRNEIQRHLSPDGARARFLEELRSRHDGRLLPAHYWPRLALIGCWKGGTVGHYLEKFGEWFDPDGRRPVPVRDWGYLASEMRGSVPLSDEGSAGVLTVATNFFEFVSEEEVTAHPDARERWNFRTAGEVENGREYYVFVTTTGGLYRYDINDIVRIEGYYHRAPQVVFMRKGRGMTNLTGEKISVNQIIEIFERAARATDISPAHFKAEADAASERYIFRVEPMRRLDEARGRKFLEELDKALKAINLEYKAKRDSLRLKPPVLHIMREGWYERDRRRLSTQGKREFQAKTQILSAMKLRTQQIQPEIELIVELET